jgi:uncharacterized protein (DUF433 family)
MRESADGADARALLFWQKDIFFNWRIIRILAVQMDEDPMFTPAEAAVLTCLSLKAVNNAIDRKAIPTVPGRRAGQATRLLDGRALISLALERRLVDRFAPDLRRAVFDALAAEPRDRITLDGGLLTIDLREPRRELAGALRALRRARALVVSDPEILGGDPVFRGTRIPVHLIATLLAQGTTDADLHAAYPRLTAAMVKSAPLYAAAYPLRGRPRAQPWHGKPPVRSARRKLETIEAG